MTHADFIMLAYGVTFTFLCLPIIILFYQQKKIAQLIRERKRRG